jgi:L-ascorbate metabolism protein UlaG (beta-lactamase superfamily)
VLGHIYPDLSDEQLEQFGLIDILVIPVGGNGYTLDATGATQLIKKMEPKIVIPTHYADSAIKYEVSQAELQVFLSEMGVSDPERMNSFKAKASELGDKTRVIVLNRLSAK